MKTEEIFHRILRPSCYGSSKVHSCIWKCFYDSGGLLHAECSYVEECQKKRLDLIGEETSNLKKSLEGS